MLNQEKYTVHTSTDYNDPDWDLFLSTLHGGVLEQTCLWARAKAVYGWEPLRFIVKDQNKIIGGFQILKRRIFKFGNIGYISKGPVFKEYVCNNEVISTVLKQIKKVVRQNRIHILIVHPPVSNDDVIYQLAVLNFKPTKLVNVVRASLLIDLSQSINEIFNQMTPGMRREIRQGLRKEIEIRSGTKADIPVFFDLMKKICDRRGIKPNPPDEQFFYKLWSERHSATKIKLFLAVYNNEVIAGSWNIGFGNIMRFWKIGWSGKYSKLRPTQLLYWESIKWAKKQGYSYFDFCSISHEAAKKMLSNFSITQNDVDGISWYKLRYGGKPVLYPDAYEYIYNPIIRICVASLFSKFLGKLNTLKK